MGKFIYVTSTEDRDYLLSLGLEMLPCNTEKKVFVFVNTLPDRLMFDEHGDLQFCVSNMLLF